MSGVGKSTVADALIERGFRTIDTDRDAARVADDGEWLWDEDAIERVLDEDHRVVFVVGTASNQVDFYGRFDCIVLLSAQTNVMLERVASRTTNEFGKTVAERSKIVADKERFEPALRRVADHELDTDRPLRTVVDEVVRLANAESDVG